jgi:plasmid replication initiation protein
MQSKPSNLVTIDNKLAQASYSLSLTEQRLLFIILSKIKPTYYGHITKEEVEAMSFEEANKRLLLNDKKSAILTEGDTFDNNTLFTLSVREYATFCNIRLDNAREDLLEALPHLAKKQVTLRKEDGSLQIFNWLQGIEYDASSDTIGLRWSYYIIPYIQNLTKYFTKLKLNNLLGLRSTYSWKLYQLLISKKGENVYKKNVEIDFESILFTLDVPISCREFKFFNSKILQKSLKEIEKQKLLKDLSVEKMLKGKRVEGLRFSWGGEGED